ncbi:MAG: DNA polymerase III subunit delta [Alphaproteobacteria bacterium]|nr:DNA polymerase III subunit delta [Alphaproteobacteria bacterium]
MTVLRGRAIENFLHRPDISTGVVLIYGPDAGLVRHTAKRLLSVVAGSPTSRTLASGESATSDQITSIHFSDLEADPARIAIEANTMSLFGGTRAVHLRGATNKAAVVLARLAEEGTASMLVVEGGALTPRDALRRNLEAVNNARVMACYPDNDRSLSELITTTFSAAEIKIDPDAVMTLRDILGNDRGVTLGELEKLTLYAATSRHISRADVLALCGDNAAIALDAILDATGTGHTARFDTAFSLALDAGIAPAAILGAALVHFSSLRLMRAEFDNGAAPEAILKKARSHFSRANDLGSQIRSLNDQRLATTCTRLHQVILTTRKNPDLAPMLARQALLSIAFTAARV